MRQLTPEEIEQLASHVHVGWMKEKQEQGYANHRYENCPDTLRKGFCPVAAIKHHSDMIPYEQLAEDIKEYDRATVRAVLVGLEYHKINLFQEPNAYFCTFCMWETESGTLEDMKAHVMQCDKHPLNIRIKELEAEIEHREAYG